MIQSSQTSTFKQFITNPDQSSLTVSRSADPRFGLTAPGSSVTLTLPNPSQPSTITRSRAIAATPLGTQLGQLDLQHETRINGRQYLGNYDAQSRSWLIRSPMGRETLIAVDAQERSAGHPVFCRKSECPRLLARVGVRECLTRVP